MEQEDKNGMLYLVKGHLNEVVSHYYHVYNNDALSVIKHLSPSLEIMMIFNFGTPVHISFNSSALDHEVSNACVLIGPLRKMLNYELAPGADAVVVNFRLNGFYRLFKIPLNNFDGETVYNPDTLVAKYCFKEFRKELSLITDLKARLNLISSYISNFVEENDDAVQPLLSGERYFYNPAVQPVKAIATDANLTERTIQLRFKKYAGYSPKELLRFLRFKMVVDRLLSEQDRSINMFELILIFGYHDQSHLIKDFQHFLGTTPRHFLKELKGREFFITGHGPKSLD